MTIFAGINNSQSWVVYGIVLPTLMGLSWDNNGIILGYHWNITYIYIPTLVWFVTGHAAVCRRQKATSYAPPPAACAVASSACVQRQKSSRRRGLGIGG